MIYRMMVKSLGAFSDGDCLLTPLGYPTSPAGVEGEAGGEEGERLS